MVRCRYGTEACQRVDMSLVKVVPSQDPLHVSACPFVVPETPAPSAIGALARAGKATAWPAVLEAPGPGGLVAPGPEEVRS